jgi:hypothetical protein
MNFIVRNIQIIIWTKHWFEPCEDMGGCIIRGSLVEY